MALRPTAPFTRALGSLRRYTLTTAPCSAQLRLRRVWVESLAACGHEAVAAALCAAAVRAARHGPLLQASLQTGGGLCEGRAKTARDLLEALAQAPAIMRWLCVATRRLAPLSIPWLCSTHSGRTIQVWAELTPHTAAAHEALAELRLLCFEADPTADAASDDGKARAGQAHAHAHAQQHVVHMTCT